MSDLDWADEWGSVRCENCGESNDLPDGRWTTECWNCDKTISAETGKVIPDGAIVMNRNGDYRIPTAEEIHALMNPTPTPPMAYVENGELTTRQTSQLPAGLGLAKSSGEVHNIDMHTITGSSIYLQANYAPEIAAKCGIDLAQWEDSGWIEDAITPTRAYLRVVADGYVFLVIEFDRHDPLHDFQVRLHWGPRG